MTFQYQVFAVNVRHYLEVQVMREQPVSETVQKILCVLYLVNYFAQHITNYTEIAAPFYEKTCAGANTTCIRVDTFKLRYYERLNCALSELLMLSQFRLDKTFIIEH